MTLSKTSHKKYGLYNYFYIEFRKDKTNGVRSRGSGWATLCWEVVTGREHERNSGILTFCFLDIACMTVLLCKNAPVCTPGVCVPF